MMTSINNRLLIWKDKSTNYNYKLGIYKFNINRNNSKKIKFKSNKL